MAEPDWFASWTTGDYRTSKTPEEMAAMHEWIAHLPPAIVDMMRAFPPSCVVRGKIRLHIPKPGGFGVVIGYRPASQQYPKGCVLVRANPYGRNEEPGAMVDMAECDVDWLEVAAFHQGLDHDETERLIAESLRLHQKDN